MVIVLVGRIHQKHHPSIKDVKRYQKKMSRILLAIAVTVRLSPQYIKDTNKKNNNNILYSRCKFSSNYFVVWTCEVVVKVDIFVGIAMYLEYFMGLKVRS